MTLGDVLAVVMGVLAIGTALWATLVGAAVLFPRKAQIACDALQQKTWHTVGVGFALVLLAGVGGLALVNVPNGLIQLIGWLFVIGLLLCACLGSAGLALLVSVRIRERDKRTRPLAALRVGAGLLVCAGFLPIVGWLVVFPVSLAASVGAGIAALTASSRRKIPSPLPASASSVASALEATGFHG